MLELRDRAGDRGLRDLQIASGGRGATGFCDRSKISTARTLNASMPGVYGK